MRSCCWRCTDWDERRSRLPRLDDAEIVRNLCQHMETGKVETIQLGSKIEERCMIREAPDHQSAVVDEASRGYADGSGRSIEGIAVVVLEVNRAVQRSDNPDDRHSQ